MDDVSTVVSIPDQLLDQALVDTQTSETQSQETLKHKQEWGE